MSTLKPVLIALSLMLVAPMAAQASEITLLPSVKLHIGDQDRQGHYWDGGRWRDWLSGPAAPPRRQREPRRANRAASGLRPRCGVVRSATARRAADARG